MLKSTLEEQIYYFRLACRELWYHILESLFIIRTVNYLEKWVKELKKKEYP